jgi:predicted nicotinamide N-methyase
LPDVTGLEVVELGCGLGLPSLVAAARGAHVTATDWAIGAVDLLKSNSGRNGLELTVELRDWREPWPARFDLALAADVLYERRNVEPLVERLSELAPVSLLALAGRPYERTFLDAWPGGRADVHERVVRLTPPGEDGGGGDHQHEAGDT